MAASTDVFVAHTEAAVADPENEALSINIHKGVTRVRKGHALYKAYPHLFEPVNEHVQYDVEAATAAPGEKRTRTKKAE